MMRAGVLLPPPRQMEKGGQMDVEYVGPLARSQRMEEAQAIDRLYQLAMNIGQIDPSIMDNIDHDEAIRMRAKLLGVPATVMRDPREVMAGRQAQQQMAAQQQAMAAAQQQSQVAKTQAEAANIMGKGETQAVMQQATAEAERQMTE